MATRTAATCLMLELCHGGDVGFDHPVLRSEMGTTVFAAVKIYESADQLRETLTTTEANFFCLLNDSIKMN